MNGANYQRLRRFQSKLDRCERRLLVLLVGMVVVGLLRPHFVPLGASRPRLARGGAGTPRRHGRVVVQDEPPTNPHASSARARPAPPVAARRTPPGVSGNTDESVHRRRRAAPPSSMCFTVVLFAPARCVPHQRRLRHPPGAGDPAAAARHPPVPGRGQGRDRYHCCGARPAVPTRRRRPGLHPRRHPVTDPRVRRRVRCVPTAHHPADRCALRQPSLARSRPTPVRAFLARRRTRRPPSPSPRRQAW